MSLLARSCAALAATALAAGVVTIAPTGVAAASRDGASAFGTTETPTSPATAATAVNGIVRGRVGLAVMAGFQCQPHCTAPRRTRHSANSMAVIAASAYPVKGADQPTSKKVRTPKRTTRGATARPGRMVPEAIGVVGNNMPLGVIPPVHVLSVGSPLNGAD